ncbi:pyridoxamine 5'-phosphate oxidase [Lampropedia puyangensis]|uniref:Pyridoxine/pyridoxamine 5'-phosphate oxidase n=1 Tax=Lampropedia puyangensis TaxID=1330072 RepID=A0A4V4GSC1_9BURK|nr:pyridoxamine 5'-phosphate oxidase [Lampropedia puyangensis]THU04146.1 pyridoxamine 5'-phosphate oxidase [Lampropedia puyangensis]
MTNIDLAAMRENYTRGSLSEQEAPQVPDALFAQWLEQAVRSQEPEANAMTLATVGNDLRPSTRIVLLKGHDAQGLVWFTNYESRKAHELAGNPQAALQFYWANLQRVVRIEGVVQKTTEQESAAYFEQRPLASRIGALTSPQSRKVANREALDLAYARIEAEVDASGKNPERPLFWGGYRLVPQYWEFWQGRVGRLHDRLIYSKDKQGQWSIDRLAP